MRKLIEASQEFDVVCDNPECDFKAKNDRTGELNDGKKWLNVPCPKCGENLLTEKDYLQWVALHKYVDWINKWFGWLTIFIKEPKERRVIETHVHDGIKMSEVEKGKAKKDKNEQP